MKGVTDLLDKTFCPACGATGRELCAGILTWHPERREWLKAWQFSRIAERSQRGDRQDWE